MSLLTAKPVLDDIRRVFSRDARTARRSRPSSACWSACRSASWRRRAITAGSITLRASGLIGSSVPVFWLGLMGLLLFYAKLHWVSGPGRLDPVFDGMVDTRTGSLLVDSLMAGEWDVFFNAVSHVALLGGDTRLLLRCVSEPNDALVHARSVEPGVHRRRRARRACPNGASCGCMRSAISRCRCSR